MIPNKKTVFLANIPSEHQKYLGGTYFNLLNWSEFFIKKQFFKYIEENRSIDFAYWENVKIYWCYYLIIYKSNTHINIKYHFLLFLNTLFFTTQYLIKFIYNKTVGKLRNKIKKDNSENEMLITMILNEYIDFIKYNSWYDFDFWYRLKAYYKLRKKSKNEFIELEKVFFLTLSFIFKQLIANIIKITHAINYFEVSPFTVIEISNISEALKSNLEIINIGKYQKNYLLGLPKYKGLKYYLEFIGENNLYSIAGNKELIVVSCIFKDINKINLINITPLCVHPIPQTNQLRVLYTVNISQILAFINFCEIKKISLEKIIDF